MPETRTYQGHTYQRAAPGQPWQLVGQAQGGVQIKQPDPTMPYKGPAAAADLQATNLGNALKAQELNKPTLIGDGSQMFDPKQRRVTPTPGYKAPAPRMTAEQAQGQSDRLAKLAAVRAQLERVAELYQSGPGATSGLSGLADFNPWSESNAAFDAAGAGLAETGLAAFRVPGVGAQSDRELQAFIDANRPFASDLDAKIEEKVGNLQRRLGAAYQGMGKSYKPVMLGALKKPASKPSNDGWKIEEVK